MNASGLLTAKETNKDLQRLAAAGTQSILLVGSKGSGALALAKDLAIQLLGLVSLQELDKYPYFYHLQVEDGKKEIPIEEVRRVVASTALKIPSPRKGIKRVVLIENAEKMSQVAQNALLKDLEEPSAATCYILTQDLGTEILPTIISRCQRVVIKNPTRQDSLSHYTSGYENKEVVSAWSLAGGAPQLMDELLKNEDHPLRLAAGDAKQFVAGDKYARVLMVNKLSDDKQKVYYFLDALEKITTLLLEAAASSAERDKILSAGRMSEAVGETRRMLEASTNTKLVLLWLATNF